MVGTVAKERRNTLSFPASLDVYKRQIVQSEIEIKKSLWPEEDYFELNVIYKASKNVSKMRKALDKHRKKLLAISRVYLSLPDGDHIFS